MHARLSASSRGVALPLRPASAAILSLVAVLLLVIASSAYADDPPKNAVPPYYIHCQYVDSPTFLQVAQESWAWVWRKPVTKEAQDADDQARKLKGQQQAAADEKIVEKEPPENQKAKQDELAKLAQHRQGVAEDEALCAKPNAPVRTANDKPLVNEENFDTLVGPGDVVVVVHADQYAEAVKRAKADGAEMHLFLNGVDLDVDGSLVSVELSDKWAKLRFHAGTGQKARKFWSMIFQEHGMLVKSPLQAAIGWKEEPVFRGPPEFPSPPRPMLVGVTSGLPITLASLFAGLLFIFFIWALRNTDAFRVAPIYPWWTDARALKTQILRAVYPKRASWFHRRVQTFNVQDIATQAALEPKIKAKYSDFSWGSASAYETAANQALAGKLPAKPDDAVIGLALRQSPWRVLRLPFSLARVQWGAWMMFATIAAIFLWVVFGEFPALTGSVLGLIAISTTTTGGSFIVDQGKAPYLGCAQGFLKDLLTGNDGVQQAHRYQAMVVNVLLLSVGVWSVFQMLAFPTFDPTWLGMLGVSGVALTVGKQVLEKSKDDASTAGKDQAGKDPGAQPAPDQPALGQPAAGQPAAE